MNKNFVICAIECSLQNDGCNSITVGDLYDRVRKTRGNINLSLSDFIYVLQELETDGLFEKLINSETICEATLISRSESHPYVPIQSNIKIY